MKDFPWVLGVTSLNNRGSATKFSFPRIPDANGCCLPSLKSALEWLANQFRNFRGPESRKVNRPRRKIRISQTVMVERNDVFVDSCLVQAISHRLKSNKPGDTGSNHDTPPLRWNYAEFADIVRNCQISSRVESLVEKWSWFPDSFDAFRSYWWWGRWERGSGFDGRVIDSLFSRRLHSIATQRKPWSPSKFCDELELWI